MTFQHSILIFLLSISFSGIIAQEQASVHKFGRMITVDDYDIHEDLLRHGYGQMKSDDCYSYDKAWFYNDSLQEGLIVDLYTDFHKTAIYHFSTDRIPGIMTGAIDLHLENGELAPLSSKQQQLPKLLLQGKALDASSFISKKGFRLGSSKEDAIREYGQPHELSREEGLDIYSWSFQGELIAPYVEQISYPMAENSFGHHIKMYFEDQKLIGMVLINDAP